MSKAGLVSPTGLPVSASASPQDVDTHTYTVRPNAAKFNKLVVDIQKKLDGMVKGTENPAVLKRQLQQKYMQMVQRRTFPDVAEVRGAKMLKLVYKAGSSELVRLYWDWLPSETGPMVLGMCPDCFVNAPSHVDPFTETRPTFIDSRLAFIRGNPEADAKVVSFRLVHPLFHMSLDERDRLTVREVVRCPSGRHGPEQRLIRRCDWVVRIEDGIISRVSRGILRGNQKRPITGPLILVK